MWSGILVVALFGQALAEGVKPAAALHVGATVPFTPLSSNATVRLEAGAFLPMVGERIAPIVMGAYSAPVFNGEATDERLGDAYTVNVRQKELMIGIGATVRLFEADRRVNPELTVAPQLQFLETVATGTSAGGAIGTTRERYAKLGFLVAAGVGIGLGPGTLTIQVGYAGTGLDGVLTGKSTTGAFNPTVGYRVTLPLGS